MTIRITTSKLNNFFVNVIKRAPSPVWGTVNVKFYYMVQTGQVPPSFIAFCNHPDAVTPAYRRFVAKQIQKEWDLLGLPVRIFVLPRGGGRRARARDEDDDLIANQNSLVESVQDYDENDLPVEAYIDDDHVIEANDEGDGVSFELDGR